jgi:hypothetical protein
MTVPALMITNEHGVCRETSPKLAKPAESVNC